MPKPDSDKDRSAGKFWRRPRVWFMLGVPAGGFLMFLAGGAALGAFNGFMAYSNTTEFCISCHEMREFVYEEYQQSAHYKNASGVRTICSDCHVPRPWGAKLLRKMRATVNELPHKILGTISTREKFEARRLELAEKVWAEMEASDSRECRSCHTLEAMELTVQDTSAQKKHSLERKLEKDETCIDCHKGVAHQLPEI
jgi:nitrate/TMAO reductase-like tetraheme cytochrome c subunit